MCLGVILSKYLRAGNVYQEYLVEVIVAAGDINGYLLLSGGECHIM